MVLWTRPLRGHRATTSFLWAFAQTQNYRRNRDRGTDACVLVGVPPRHRGAGTPFPAPVRTFACPKNAKSSELSLRRPPHETPAAVGIWLNVVLDGALHQLQPGSSKARSGCRAIPISTMTVSTATPVRSGVWEVCMDGKSEVVPSIQRLVGRGTRTCPVRTAIGWTGNSDLPRPYSRRLNVDPHVAGSRGEAMHITPSIYLLDNQSAQNLLSG